MTVNRALPAKRFESIFREYYYCSLSEADHDNTGIVIDDGLFEIHFIKEKDIWLVVNGQQEKMPQINVIGKAGVPTRTIIPNRLTSFSIKIQPWAAFVFLEKNFSPLSELTEARFPNINRLHEQIFSTDNFATQVDYVETFFSPHNLPKLANHEITQQICQLIYREHGKVTISDIVAMLPYSRQKINRLFRQQTKYSIKEFAVLTRLRAIMSHYVKHPDKSLTELSYAFGYFDQSHFIRDMKRMTGVAPRNFSQTSNLFFEQLKYRDEQ
ncbi:MAG: helix-turn-helix domain-containing protein [Bacteroidota bacterium]